MQHHCRHPNQFALRIGLARRRQRQDLRPKVGQLGRQFGAQQVRAEDFAVAANNGKPGKSLTVTMKYSPERDRVISGITRVSKPGLRVYSKADGVPRVLGGLGVAVLSTSNGLMQWSPIWEIRSREYFACG